MAVGMLCVILSSAGVPLAPSSDIPEGSLSHVCLSTCESVTTISSLQKSLPVEQRASTAMNFIPKDSLCPYWWVFNLGLCVLHDWGYLMLSAPANSHMYTSFLSSAFKPPQHKPHIQSHTRRVRRHGKNCIKSCGCYC